MDPKSLQLGNDLLRTIWIRWRQSLSRKSLCQLPKRKINTIQRTHWWNSIPTMKTEDLRSNACWGSDCLWSTVFVLSQQPQIDHEWVDSMRQFLFDNDFEVRLQAIANCKRALPSEMHPDLVECMNDQDGELRLLATEAVGFQSLSTNLLLHLLSADNDKLASYAAQSLTQQSNLPLEVLFALTYSSGRKDPAWLFTSWGSRNISMQ